MLKMTGSDDISLGNELLCIYTVWELAENLIERERGSSIPMTHISCNSVTNKGRLQLPRKDLVIG